jgi:SAM-dependent methyltransferase
MSASDCVLCGKREYESLFTSTDRLYRTTRERFLVVRCRRCGLMRLEPRPSPKRLRAYYPADYWFAPEASVAGRLEEAYRRLVLRDHVRFVRRAVEAAGVPGPVLDIGCGGGLFPGMMRERGFRVLGLDISPKAAAVAWRRHGVPAVCGLPAAAPLAEESCAAVTMFHVLEHLDDPRACLRAVRALLRPGGRLVVQTPDAACWQFRLLGAAWTGVDVPRHLVDFRASDLEALLAACGFEVVRRKHFSLRDNPAGLASSLAPGLDPMARRVRRVPEGNRAKLAKDLLYLGLVAAALPFAALEAAFRAGSTVMIEARRP